MAAEHHTGSCQCGAVAFEADVDISRPNTCDCSRCRRVGSRLAFTPKSAFKLVRGSESLTEYTFNKEVIRHQFCRTCGVQTFSFGDAPDGTAMVAINVNCIDGVDLQALPTQHVNGAAL